MARASTDGDGSSNKSQFTVARKSPVLIRVYTVNVLLLTVLGWLAAPKRLPRNPDSGSPFVV